MKTLSKLTVLIAVFLMTCISLSAEMRAMICPECHQTAVNPYQRILNFKEPQPCHSGYRDHEDILKIQRVYDDRVCGNCGHRWTVGILSGKGEITCLYD